MLTTATNIQILSILQICDSNFPVGSFNHSFGMETYLREGKIDDVQSLKKWLDIFLEHQFCYNEGLAFYLINRYLEDNEIEKIWDIDNLLTVQTTSKESRDGNKLIGQRMIKTYLELNKIPLLLDYEQQIKNKRCYGNPAVATAILMNSLGVGKKLGLMAYMYSTLSTLIQNGVRAIPLGQRDGLLLLQDYFEKFEEMAERIMKLDFDDLGLNVPGLEIAQINHEDLVFRLFMS